MSEKVVTRFAPSPTGFMHVGGVRTAIFAYLWAKKNSGVFILRIEDTDKKREVDGSVAHIIKTLKWLGINWDEGPEINGKNAPYKQSERLDLYKEYAQILVNKGVAYPDPYTEEEIAAFRKKAESENKPFLFRNYRPKKFEKWDGIKSVRLKVNNVKRYEWNDLVFGNLSAGEEALDDFVLLKNDGYPTYNFAHIIDDIKMGVTHVMRGQEFISSIPKFLSLYEALETKPPCFVTLPPILSREGNKKLSKRDGAKDILEYKNEGYLPEAMFNFLTFLGWNPGNEQEIFTKKELIDIFDIKKIQKSGAQFNEAKLSWINKEYIKKLSHDKLQDKIFERLPENYRNKKLIPIIAERISKFADIEKMIETGELDFFFKQPKYQRKKLIYKNVSDKRISENIYKAILAIEKLSKESFHKENIKNALMQIANGLENNGELLHPIRFALSGLNKSPDPFTIAEILGKKETLSRFKKAILILKIEK